MEPIYSKLAELIEAGETVAVATIVDVKGSVPREVGAKMIIHPLGQHVGTVGGGCGEGDVIRAGLDVIQTGEPALVRVDLTEDVSMQTLGVCGGILDVFVEQVTPAALPGLPAPAARVAALRASMSSREPTALVTVINGPSAGCEAVVWPERPPLGDLGLGEMTERVLADAQTTLQGRQHKLLKYKDAGDLQVFVEVQRRAPELVIVGAGHIALPLAQMGSLCDFSVTVLDDRAQFASQKRFPTANKVITAPLRETVREMSLDRDSYIVLVTRGHSQDVECLLEMIDRPVGYIGMIGSQRRVDAVFTLLEDEMGIDPIKFDSVYAPIGIYIGAHTPAEIAVCIMAEIINVYRGGTAPSISEKRRERARRRRAADDEKRKMKDEG